MNIKKLALTGFALILALSIIAASVFPVTISRIKKGQYEEVSSGRAGVVFTKSQFTGDVRVARTGDSRIFAINHPKFIHEVVSIRLTKIGGENVRFVLGPVYVFFVVDQREFRSWERGELDLLYFDPWHSEWVPCGAFPVEHTNSKPRIACRMYAFGTFGLAEKK
jgi:hypothetical protein